MIDSSREHITVAKRRSMLVEAGIRLVKEKRLGTFGGIMTLLLLLTAIFANVLAPFGMNETNIADKLMAPSARYWMGTDKLGRDILSRVIFGARISVVVGLAASTLTALGAVVLGTTSAYIGGKFDLILQRFVDAFMSVPGLILMMIMITVIGPGVWQVIVVLGVWGAIQQTRVIRSAVIGIKENEYMQLSVAIGCSTTRIIIRHVLPNVMAPIIIVFSTRVPSAILTEASLSFLGFGVPPPTPSWGAMLSGQARVYMLQAPWMAIWPGLALAITVYSINMFGDALRDLLDPRLRGGVGRYGGGRQRKFKCPKGR
jgi:peptide/nickel transport system permease protein